MTRLDKISIYTLILGGMNWLVAGLLGFDGIALLFGTLPFVMRTLYLVIGLSAIHILLRILWKAGESQPQKMSFWKLVTK